MDLVLAAVPLLASALLGMSSSWLGRRLPPSAAVKVLAITAFTTALATGFCLSLVAFGALARIPAVAAVGRWSAGAIGLDGTPPPVGGAVLGLTVLGLFTAALHRSLRTAADLATATLASRRLHDLSDGLVLIQDPSPDAFALPGLRGKIVITTGMLTALTAAERRALIAHEQAHLSDHHQLYIQAANLAATANPLLRPAAEQVRQVAERWADEQAASHVNDRHLTARALAKAALARHASRHRPVALPRLALAGAHGAIAWRTLALTQPRPKPRPRLAAAVLSLAVTSLVASFYLAHSTETEIERAQRAYLAPTAHPRRHFSQGTRQGFAPPHELVAVLSPRPSRLAPRRENA